MLKMVKYENQYTNGELQHIENTHPNSHVSHHYCNEECEVNQLYKYDIDATELCETCLPGKFKTIK